MLHVACRPASRSSRRVIITKPMPWSRAASGSSVPSAPRATRRTTMCARQRADPEDRHEEADARWDLGVRAERRDRVGGAGDERRHDQQRRARCCAGAGRTGSRAIAPGGELVGDGHGALVVVAPVGAARRWRRCRRSGRAARSGRSWSAAASSWWSMSSWWWSWSSWRSSLRNCGGLLVASRTRAVVVDLGGPIGFELVTRRAAGRLRGRIEPEHAAVAALVDDRPRRRR